MNSYGYVNIINSSMLLENATVIKSGNKFNNLELKVGGQKVCFNLHVAHNEIVTNGQTIASLTEKAYQTESGGILYYSTVNYSPKSKRKRSSKTMFTGSLYWIPEETYSVNSTTLESIKIKNGTFIKKGEGLLENISASISGIVHIDSTNKEVIIKPGELYQIKNFNFI
jgi:hypothetical protein